MPTATSRRAALAVLAVAIVAAAVALDLPSAAAQSDESDYWPPQFEQTGRIVARRLDDGRTEFGWQPAGGARVLPSARYFPADAAVDRWQSSSPVEVDGAEIGRIDARLNADGRIEFGFTPTGRGRILTDARYFPAAPRPNRWLRSTEIAIGLPPRNPFTAVSAGYEHTCAIRESGAIECWGRNETSQWNEETGRYVEVYGGQTDVPTGSFSAVSAGNEHTCAIRESGAIECWGSNEYGQTDPPAGSFTAVSAGAAHTCAIRDGGEIECWGWNRYGQAAAPTGSFTAVSAGDSHTCAIRDTGAIECWGANHPLANIDYGQTDAPAGRFSAVAAGYVYTCGLRESGAIECWGNNEWRQADAPAGSFTAISAYARHTCAIRAGSGSIWCWGRGREGQLDAPAPFAW